MRVGETMGRIEALDVFRGLAVLCMIFVNAVPRPDLAPAFMLPAVPYGLSFADLVFPAFIFAVGISGAVWLDKRAEMWFHDCVLEILKRAAVLFLLGIVYNVIPLLYQHLFPAEPQQLSFFSDLVRHLRFFGVLQRIALAYAGGMILYCFFRSNQILCLLAIALLAGSSAGAHIYAPDTPYDLATGIYQAVDGAVISAGHSYMSVLPDPEGLYGVISSIATVLFGILSGQLLMVRNLETVPSQVTYGIGLFILGFVWSFLDPVSRPLWTAPYTLLTAGVFFLVTACLHVLYCVAPSFSRAVFHFPMTFGRNAIFAYFAMGILLPLYLNFPVKGVSLATYLWDTGLSQVLAPAFFSFCYALIWCVLWLPIFEYFYEHQIFFKV